MAKTINISYRIGCRHCLACDPEMFRRNYHYKTFSSEEYAVKLDELKSSAFYEMINKQIKEDGGSCDRF